MEDLLADADMAPKFFSIFLSFFLRLTSSCSLTCYIMLKTEDRN